MGKAPSFESPYTAAQMIEMQLDSGTTALRLLLDVVEPEHGANPLTYEEWIARYMPEVFPLSFGPHQRFITESLRADLHTLRLALSAPRESGKSSFVKYGLPTAAIALGTHEFPLIIDTKQRVAETQIRKIRGFLERNAQGVCEIFPNLQYVRKHNSKTKARVETMAEIQLAGGWIAAAGAQERIRGINAEMPDGRIIRPDLILADEVQDKDQARSKARTEELIDFIFSDVIGLGSVMRSVSLILIGTPLGPDCLISQALEGRGYFATWKRRKFPLIERSPDGTEHLFWPERYNWATVRQMQRPGNMQSVPPATFAREYLLAPQEARGAMWTSEIITETHDFSTLPFDQFSKPDKGWFDKIVVAIDPAWTGRGDLCGIAVVGRKNKVAYVLEDRSIKATPEVWAQVALTAYKEWQADAIIAESQHGGSDVEAVMKLADRRVPIRIVRATRGKKVRFDPIVALYHRGQVKHVGTDEYPLLHLEDQMMSWVPPDPEGRGGSTFSPDRADAVVWSIWHLLLDGSTGQATLATAVNSDVHLPSHVGIGDGRAPLRMITGGRGNRTVVL